MKRSEIQVVNSSFIKPVLQMIRPGFRCASSRLRTFDSPHFAALHAGYI
jgi:hypothetical protein